MSEELIAESTSEATLEAPLQAIDLAEWVFTLNDAEYQACSVDHIAAASSVRPDGRRVSINVERVGNLMVQHYVEDVAAPGRCRLVSTSDSIGPDIKSRTQVRVVWEFAVEAIDATTTRFSNTVSVHELPGYRASLAQRGVPFDRAREGAQLALGAHNAEETPLFALDIARKAQARRWG